MDPFHVKSEVYKLLGDRNRLMILALLKEADLCVCEIVGIMHMSQPNVSQHMRKLKTGGLVSETKKGQWVIYSLQVEDKPFVLFALNDLPNLKNKIIELESKGLRVSCS